MVKVQPEAAFGSFEETARVWSYAWYEAPWVGLASLYPNGQGLREIRQGGELTAYVPLSWRFEGRNVVQDAVRPNIYTRQRTWQPVATQDKYRFVMESEWIDFLQGDGPQALLPLRLVFVEDLGAAAVPTVQLKQPKITHPERLNQTKRGAVLR